MWEPAHRWVVGADRGWIACTEESAALHQRVQGVSRRRLSERMRYSGGTLLSGTTGAHAQKETQNSLRGVQVGLTPLRRQYDRSTLLRAGRPIDDHPVIEPRYRAAPCLAKCRRDDPMQETRDGADEHPRAEGHCLPLMAEIRFAHRARMVQEEPIEHCADLASAPSAITVLHLASNVFSH